MGALDVLPLPVAKRHLRIPEAQTEYDEAIKAFIPPAVERVERHLAGQDGVGKTLFYADTVTASAQLACKVVLAEYWRTQRAQTQQTSRNAAYADRVGGVEPDTGLAGMGSLDWRLTEILGVQPFDDQVSDPQGSFPEPEPWPDPIRVPRGRY